MKPYNWTQEDRTPEIDAAANAAAIDYAEEQAALALYDEWCAAHPTDDEVPYTLEQVLEYALNRERPIDVERDALEILEWLNAEHGRNISDAFTFIPALDPYGPMGW